MSHALPSALLVDLGGTHCRTGLAVAGRLDPATCQRVANDDFGSLEELLLSYLASRNTRVASLSAGVAGPVRGDRAQLTNHAWHVDGPSLARALGAMQSVLLNDLQAQAYGLDDLTPDAVTTLIPAAGDANGPRMVFCLGTGCNIAVAHRQGDRLFVPPSESGHTTLPDAPEFRTIYDALRPEFPHLPIEALLSGPGLSRTHTALTGETRTPAEIIAAKPQETLGTFSRILGLVAGNLALSHMATGGVYLIGGLARAIAPHLAGHGFRAPFCDRGPYAGIMADIPVHVVEDDNAALLGCARYLRQTTA